MGTSLLLSALGGVAGAMLGTAATYAVATSHGWQTLVPVTGVWGGLAATFVIGGAHRRMPGPHATFVVESGRSAPTLV
jgi:putative ABC transport system permease protein